MATSIAGKGANLANLAVKSEKLSRFVDCIRVKFQGGRGGDGCIAMLKLFANEMAGPAGGNGGCGGHVVLRANRQVKSLGALQTFYKAEPGVRGQGKNWYGANGAHTFVEVPIGTIVSPSRPKYLAEHEFQEDESQVVDELDQEGSMFIAARGGAGGRGNASYLSNKNRHPRVAEAGAQGEVREYELRMRLYAHIGLIGLPNAGKSSLLRRLTHAQVRVGDYSFTTLYPQVGVIEYADYTQVAISDLPGLIEGSHLNRGLGVRFLKNVMRCSCLLYVIDLTVSDPVGQLRLLFNELEQSKKGLSNRPHLILGNKIDAGPSAECKLAELERYLARERPDSKVISCSTLRGDNLELLRLELRQMYDSYLAEHGDEPGEALVW